MTRPTLNSQAAALADDSLDRGAQLQNIRQVSTRVRSVSPPGDDLPPDPAPEPVHDHEDSDHEHPENPYGEEPTTTLAEAIMLMTQELRRRETTPRAPGKVKEPDTFDGSEPRKLNNFILLCNLYFRNNPYYADDEAKVTFALSYLRGTALEYFEPSILDSEDAPAWMDHWPAFVRTLRTQFGPIDPTADAEQGESTCRSSQGKREGIFGFEKSVSSSQTSAQTEDCVAPSCAPMEAIRLNASALSDPNSFHLQLSSPLISDPNFSFRALVDSGSTHCFVDTKFAQRHNLPLIPVKPIELKLFDGTSNSVITQSIDLPVKFPSGEFIIFNFYVTLLDPSCSVVLGYNWLTRYNPLINWVLGS